MQSMNLSSSVREESAISSGAEHCVNVDMPVSYTHLKFVKELNDSTKQSEQPSNAERTATEQVETTAREIVHEAVQLPRRAIQHTARRESADSLRAVCWIARRGSWTASWTISRAVVSTCSVAVRSALLGCSDCFVLSFNSFTNFRCV